MNFGHSGLTRWGLGFIDIARDIDALDIGCGGGKAVKRLAKIATDGKVVGIDYSPDAVVKKIRERVIVKQTSHVPQKQRIDLHLFNLRHPPDPPSKKEYNIINTA